MKNGKTISIAPLKGWVLIAPINARKDSDKWYVCWADVFTSKKSAIAFAVENNWPQPYKTVRGQMTAI